MISGHGFETLAQFAEPFDFDSRPSRWAKVTARSLASISSWPQLDKERMSQTLDQIHNAASQSETLTTFNDFTLHHHRVPEVRVKDWPESCRVA
jgi:hypothetical protein